MGHLDSGINDSLSWRHASNMDGLMKVALELLTITAESIYAIVKTIEWFKLLFKQTSRKIKRA
jgi:hypothetical protein